MKSWPIKKNIAVIQAILTPRGYKHLKVVPIEQFYHYDTNPQHKDKLFCSIVGNDVKFSDDAKFNYVIVIGLAEKEINKLQP